MTSRKPQYVLGIDLDHAEQERLKRFVPLFGGRSVRAFVKEAILNEMQYRLDELPPDKRDMFEALLAKH